jgi:hypothetical protein
MAKQSFSVGQVLTANQMLSLQQTAMLGGAASAKTANYTLVAADAGTGISMSSTSATTVTVNTGLFAAGDTVQITNLDTGVCTITAGTATVNTSASLALAQYESGTLYFTSASASIFIKGAGGAGGGGAYTLINPGGTTLSGASVAITSIPQTYRNLQIVVEAFKPVTSGSLLFMRFNQDSSANQHANSTGIFQGAYSFNQTGSQITKAETANWDSVAIVDVYNYTSTTTRRKGMVWGIGSSASDENANFCIGYKPTTAISSFLFYADVGNMDSGTVYLYGVK